VGRGGVGFWWSSHVQKPPGSFVSTSSPKGGDEGRGRNGSGYGGYHFVRDEVGRGRDEGTRSGIEGLEERPSGVGQGVEMRPGRAFNLDVAAVLVGQP